MGRMGPMGRMLLSKLIRPIQPVSPIESKREKQPDDESQTQSASQGIQDMVSLNRSFRVWISVLLATVMGSAQAENLAPNSRSWPSFRNGGTSVAQHAQLPIKWSATEGIAWQLELKGYGQSAPVTWNGVVFVTSVEGPQKEKCLLTAFDVATGQQQWQTEIKASTGLPSNYSVARAAPTPVVDARGVYAFFEGGDVVAVDHQGKVLWQRSLTTEFGKFDNHHGLGSSPAQSADAVFVNIQHRGPSYLIALDKATGQTKWKVDRKSSQSWSSPVTFERGEQTQVVLSSGGSVDSYAATTGEKLWSIGELSGNSVPSPLIAGSQLFLGATLSDFEVSENAAKSNLCLEFAGNGQASVKWRATRALSDYASPVVCGECVYFINRTGIIYCLDRQTGNENYARRLPSACWATPIVNDGKLYLFGRNGVTTVIKAGPEWVELAQNELWDNEHPPKPETYVETQGGPGHGHGHPGGATADANAGTEKGRSAEERGGARAAGGTNGAGGPGGGGGFAAMLLKHDKNGDGKVDEQELPEDFRRALARGDKNGDKALDAEEIKLLGEEFRKRRESSASESRDPIVYGTAISDNTLLLRTGTRLYAVRAKSVAVAQQLAPMNVSIITASAEITSETSAETTAEIRVATPTASGDVVSVTSTAGTQPKSDSKKLRPVTRLIFEDHKDQSLRWADVGIDEDKQLHVGAAQPVPGVKPLDASKQKLVQMKEHGGFVLAGIRDEEKGAFQSGWVLIDAGVRYEDHGDHGHWRYPATPRQLAATLDQKQGNPAHIYAYDGKFFIANDQLNGFTRVDPALVATAAGAVEGTSNATSGTQRASAEQKPTLSTAQRFYEGGGNHITLAAVNDQVAYATWVDGGGPNKGRVDVTKLGGKDSKLAYSFFLSSGGLHGATTNQGKVFFAPSDGIVWLTADLTASLKPDAVKWQHISLGKSDDKPLRTGAFATFGNYVLCVTGRGTDAKLVMIDASQSTPTPQFLSLKSSAATRALTPVIAQTKTATYAFVMHDAVEHDDDSEAAPDERLEIISLDPNGDRNFADAQSLKTLKLGRSAVEGHSGHHDITCDASRRFAFVTNPGDATIMAISLATLEPAGTYPIGGKPTALIAIGGR